MHLDLFDYYFDLFSYCFDVVTYVLIYVLLGYLIYDLDLICELVTSGISH